MSSTGGAIQQIYTTGIQDTFLTGKPKHDFIKQMYRQYDNFAIERIKITGGVVDFGKQVTFEIKKVGDFLKNAYFTFSLPALTQTSGTMCGWTNGVGYAIIDYAEIRINGVFINRRYGMFMMIWDQLTKDPGTRNASDSLVGYYQNLSSLQYNANQESFYNVDLGFWFGENISSALPLLNLSQTSFIEIVVKLNTFDKCIVYDGDTPPNTVNITDAWLTTDQIFVDESYKKRFRGQQHVYLIKQLQYLPEEVVGVSKKIQLNFNHPVSQLVFVLREHASEENNDWFNFSSRGSGVAHEVVDSLLSQAKLIIDAKDRIEFMTSQQLSTVNSNLYYPSTVDSFIYTIPFCNKPAEWFPNGSLNFSLVQSAELVVNLVPGRGACTAHVFAMNFNFITFNGKFCKLEFSD